VFSEIGAGDATQLLSDALGSVRGLADANGSLVGSRSYEAFGNPRTTSGAASLFGFTGEPTDTTGLVYLRARWLDSETGRLLSTDTVFPNAQGTQGFNLYTYVANNPATWTDPTGHQLEMMSEGMLVSMLALVLAVGFGAVLGLAGGGSVFTFPSVSMYVMAWLLICLGTTGCRTALTDAVMQILQGGSAVIGTVIHWTAQMLLSAIRDFPLIPVVLPPVHGIGPPGPMLAHGRGNVADTGILEEANQLIAAGLAATICEALDQLYKAAKAARDKVQLRRVETTQKAKGCRHSRNV
jgi:RHS repeat-associated protein